MGVGLTAGGDEDERERTPRERGDSPVPRLVLVREAGCKEGQVNRNWRVGRRGFADRQSQRSGGCTCCNGEGRVRVDEVEQGQRRTHLERSDMAGGGVGVESKVGGRREEGESRNTLAFVGP